MGFPSGASGKESACQCRRLKKHRLKHWVGKIPWRRAWPPTPVLLPGEFRGQRSLVGYNPWGHKESDKTEHIFTVSIITPLWLLVLTSHTFYIFSFGFKVLSKDFFSPLWGSGTSWLFWAHALGVWWILWDYLWVHLPKHHPLAVASLKRFYVLPLVVWKARPKTSSLWAPQI